MAATSNQQYPKYPNPEGAKKADAEELRRLHAEVAASRDARDALEQRVLIRRQATCVLQLAERAVAAETPHAGDVVSGANEDTHDDDVALPERKLEELRRRVEAKELKAAARVKEAEAIRCAVKASRTAAVVRLDGEAATEIHRRPLSRFAAVTMSTPTAPASGRGALRVEEAEREALLLGEEAAQCIDRGKSGSALLVLCRRRGWRRGTFGSTGSTGSTS